ncbi:MAG: prepilin-type N-terminal cleavage/methylation domain-containing protein [Negativicutes bacterium]
MKIKNKFGFTVVELLVVVAILGILAAIILPRFVGQDIVAKQKKVLSDLASIDAALQLYNMDNGAWPTSSDLTFLSTSGYMAAVPAPPTSQSGFSVGTSYSYKITNSGTSYTVLRGAVFYDNGGWGWYDTSDTPLTTW